MKMFARLEKSKSFWYLLAISLLFFLLRLPSLIEPYWYGDEGIYQTIGIAMNNNRLLYSEIWDNKPPLLYLLYALFNGDQFQVRLLSLITGLLSTWTFFYLSIKLFANMRASIVSTTFFAVLFAVPLLEGNIANAENFMLLPIIAAGSLIYTYSQNTKYTIFNTKYLLPMVAGLLLGIAFLFKIVAIFDLAAFLLFFIIVNLPKKLSWHMPLIHNSLFIIFGFILPIIAAALFFLSQNTLYDFTQAVFLSNIGYVGYRNELIIPQGFLILKLILLAVFALFVFLKRERLTQPIIFIILWLGFTLFSAFFSGRPYTHYSLIALPALSLTIGLIVAIKTIRAKTALSIAWIIIIVCLSTTFTPNYTKALSYYENALLFITDKKDIYAYWSFFDSKTPRNYEIASFIKSHTKQDDNVFIWGDSAQIYALSGKLPPGKYTVSYHIVNNGPALSETQSAINSSKPKYIVALTDAPPLPFYLPNYVSKFALNEAIIYERTI